MRAKARLVPMIPPPMMTTSACPARSSISHYLSLVSSDAVGFRGPANVAVLKGELGDRALVAAHHPTARLIDVQQSLLGTGRADAEQVRRWTTDLLGGAARQRVARSSR